MDINEAGKISDGMFEEDMLTFDFPRNTPPVFEGDVEYGGLSREQEDKMLAAARSDLVKLLNLPVKLFLLSPNSFRVLSSYSSHFCFDAYCLSRHISFERPAEIRRCIVMLYCINRSGSISGL